MLLSCVLFNSYECRSRWGKSITELQSIPDQFWLIPSGRESWPVEVADKFANNFTFLVSLWEFEMFMLPKPSRKIETATYFADYRLSLKFEWCDKFKLHINLELKNVNIILHMKHLLWASVVTIAYLSDGKEYSKIYLPLSSDSKPCIRDDSRVPCEGNPVKEITNMINFFPSSQWERAQLRRNRKP